MFLQASHCTWDVPWLDLTTGTVNPSELEGEAEGGQQVPLQHAGSHTLATERDTPVRLTTWDVLSLLEENAYRRCSFLRDSDNLEMLTGLRVDVPSAFLTEVPLWLDSLRNILLPEWVPSQGMDWVRNIQGLQSRLGSSLQNIEPLETWTAL